MKFLVLVFLLPFFSLSAKAQTPPMADQYSEEFIYQATKEACSKLSGQVLRSSGIIHDNLRAGYFPSKKFTELQTAIRRETFASAHSYDYGSDSSLAKKIMFSPGFRRALDECYGKDDFSIKYFEKTVERSTSAGRWVGSAVNLIEFYGVSRVFSIGFASLKKLSYLQSFWSAKHAALRKWLQRSLFVGAGTYASVQVYQAKDAVYQASLLWMNKQTEFLEAHPNLKAWLKGELKAQHLASDVDDVIEHLNEEIEMLDDIIIVSTKQQIMDLYVKRASLTDPEAIKIVDDGIELFKGRLAERVAQQKQKSSKPKISAQTKP